MDGCKILHARNGREYRPPELPNLSVDGFCAETNTVRGLNAGGARFSAIQTGPGGHPASCTMGTRSILGAECGRGVTLTPHPLLVPRYKIE